MNIPIPNRIIRLVFRELLYLKLEENSEFQPIGIAYTNANRGCPFGREMVERAFEELIDKGMLESNKVSNLLLECKYRFTKQGLKLIENGNFEDIFNGAITNRFFIFNNNGEYGFSDIYEKNHLSWKLLNYEIDLDEITKSYFNIAENLNFQIWMEENRIKLAAKYLGHIRLIQIPFGLIKEFILEIYEKAKEPAKLRLVIADTNLRGVLLEGYFNEYNYNDHKQRVWNMEHEVIPQILRIFNAKLIQTKRLINA